ncbi:unnamed protein product [Ectocarpus sp. 12 AP-2014]
MIFTFHISTVVIVISHLQIQAKSTSPLLHIAALYIVRKQTHFPHSCLNDEYLQTHIFLNCSALTRSRLSKRGNQFSPFYHQLTRFVCFPENEQRLGVGQTGEWKGSTWFMGLAAGTQRSVPEANHPLPSFSESGSKIP